MREASADLKLAVKMTVLLMLVNSQVSTMNLKTTVQEPWELDMAQLTVLLSEVLEVSTTIFNTSLPRLLLLVLVKLVFSLGFTLTL